jgi:alkaline phosphatase
LAGAASLAAQPDRVDPALRIGVLTDVHYADAPPAGTRYYRESETKLAEAVEQFVRSKAHCVVELGDLIDTGASLDAEKEHLRRIAKTLARFPGPRHCVLGNHCVYRLAKPEFLEIVGQNASYYSFDVGGWHLVVLDACFRRDGQAYGRKNFSWTEAMLPPDEIEWLRADLARTPHKTILFVHQRLDVKPPYGVLNAPDVRKLLEESGKVLAVFQGHEHRGDLKEIRGIRYITLKAMVEGAGPENNAYALVDLLPGDAIRIAGFRRETDHRW